MMKLSLKSLGLSKKYAVIILMVLLTLLIFIGPTCSSFSESVVPYNSVIEGMLEGPNYEYVNLAGCTFQQADMYSTTDKPSILLQLHGPNDIIQPTGLQELLNSNGQFSTAGVFQHTTTNGWSQLVGISMQGNDWRGQPFIFDGNKLGGWNLASPLKFIIQYLSPTAGTTYCTLYYSGGVTIGPMNNPQGSGQWSYTDPTASSTAPATSSGSTTSGTSSSSSTAPAASGSTASGSGSQPSAATIPATNYEYVNLAGCQFSRAGRYSTTGKPIIFIQIYPATEIIKPTGQKLLANSNGSFSTAAMFQYTTTNGWSKLFSTSMQGTDWRGQLFMFDSDQLGGWKLASPLKFIIQYTTAAGELTTCSVYYSGGVTIGPMLNPYSQGQWSYTDPTASSASGSTPAASGSTPAASGSTPAASGSTPAASGSTPAASGSTPAASGSTPAASGSTGPAASGSTPAASGSTPSASGSTPSSTTGSTTGSTPGSTPSSTTGSSTGSTPASSGSTPIAPTISTTNYQLVDIANIQVMASGNTEEDCGNTPSLGFPIYGATEIIKPSNQALLNVDLGFIHYHLYEHTATGWTPIDSLNMVGEEYRGKTIAVWCSWLAAWSNINSPLKFSVTYKTTALGNPGGTLITSTVYYSGGISVAQDGTITPTGQWSYTDPTASGSSPAPVSGGSTAAPASGGSSPSPASGGSTAAAPVSGGSTAAPVSGGSTAAPVSGGSTAAPVSGGSSNINSEYDWTTNDEYIPLFPDYPDESTRSGSSLASNSGSLIHPDNSNTMNQQAYQRED